MVNRGQINRFFVNRNNKNSNSIYINEHLSEKLMAYLSSGVVFRINERLSERLKTTVSPSRAIYIKVAQIEKLEAKALPTTTFFIKAELAEELGGGILLGGRIGIRESMGEALNLRGVLGANIGFKHSLKEKLKIKTLLGADISITSAMQEALRGYTSLLDLIENSMNIDITIPPGGTLVIDSDAYTVLLDNIDFIDRHSGDWIYAGRETLDFTVQLTGATDSEMEVYYIAKYL